MAPTTMEAPADTSAGFDAALDDVVGDLTGSDSEAQPTEEVSAGEALPGGEAPTPAPDTTTPQQSPPGEGPASEYQLSEDGSHYLVPKDQLGVFQTNKEYLAKVQEKFPTVSDAEEAYLTGSSFKQLRSDFLYNGDEGADNVLAYLSGKDVDAQHPEVRAQFEQSFQRFMSKAPGVLEQMSPDVHRGVVSNLIKPYIDGAYAHAAETGDPAILKAAQNVDWYFTGQYQKEAPKFDPQAAQVQAQTQREQQISQREQSLLDRDWNAYTQQNVEGAKRTDFNTELDRALAPFKDKYDPETFADIRDGISRRLIAKLSEDNVWANEHSNQFKMLKNSYDAAWKSGRNPNAQAAQAWKNDFMMRVRRYLPSIAEARLKGTPAKAAAPRTTKTAPTPARPNVAPARAQNGQFTREQQKSAFDKAAGEVAELMGF